MNARPNRQEPERTFLQRWLPHPLLTLLLIVLWLALMNSYSVATWISAITIGMAIPIYTAGFWPGRPRINRPHRALGFVLIVIWDILVANIQVAYLILFRRNENLRTRWVTVPIELTNPEAIAVLMGTITLTPGTVSSDLSNDSQAILVHCLDVGDEDELVRTIKNRYEARLKVIFP